MKAFSPGLYSTDPDQYDNRIIISRLNFYERLDSNSQQLSIKYVRKGNENYKVGNYTHSVRSDNFLIVNKSRAIETSLRDSDPVLGVCFFLDNGFLNGVNRNLLNTDETLLDNPFDAFQKSEFEFCEEVFHTRENSLGTLISEISDEVYTKGINFNPEPMVFYDLAEKVFGLQGVIQTQTIALGSVEASTRNELYRRIRIATRFIESNYQRPIDIANLAKECSLSEFHFLRSFSRIHGTTPYQFILSKKLAKAAELLNSKRLVSDVAAISGFSDVAAFSKAFKKTFNVTPSKFADLKETGINYRNETLARN